jgi:hypothetical protein
MAYQDPEDQNLDNGDDDGDEQPESNDIRNLRRKAQKADALARENALLKAGINTDTPLGQMFKDAYQGELTTDAIKAAWATVAPPAPETTEQETEPTAEEKEFAAEREGFASGAGDDGKPPDRNPRKEALEIGLKALDEGLARDEAMGMAFSHLAGAASQGDERVILK